MSALPAPLEALADAVLAGERAALARVITLAESRRADHRGQARATVAADEIAKALDCEA